MINVGANESIVKYVSAADIREALTLIQIEQVSEINFQMR